MPKKIHKLQQITLDYIQMMCIILNFFQKTMFNNITNFNKII